mmetsp:Transcript_16815/g.23811  ORF Transcript_16815/g.23811 Transcript_16815/m.23811 type:complete len:80 (+) Transcript_16815:1074-1313(+)
MSNESTEAPYSAELVVRESIIRRQSIREEEKTETKKTQNENSEKPTFNIFDGTNASEDWKEFIDNISLSSSDEEEGKTE